MGLLKAHKRVKRHRSMTPSRDLSRGSGDNQSGCPRDPHRLWAVGEGGPRSILGPRGVAGSQAPAPRWLGWGGWCQAAGFLLLLPGVGQGPGVAALADFS